MGRSKATGKMTADSLNLRWTKSGSDQTASESPSYSASRQKAPRSAPPKLRTSARTPPVRAKLIAPTP